MRPNGSSPQSVEHPRPLALLFEDLLPPFPKRFFVGLLSLGLLVACGDSDEPEEEVEPEVDRVELMSEVLHEYELFSIEPIREVVREEAALYREEGRDRETFARNVLHFVRGWVAENPDAALDVVPEDERDRFREEFGMVAGSSAPER